MLHYNPGAVFSRGRGVLPAGLSPDIAETARLFPPEAHRSRIGPVQQQKDIRFKTYVATMYIQDSTQLSGHVDRAPSGGVCCCA